MKRAAAAIACVIAGSLASPGQAQSPYPARPITLIFPYAPGTNEGAFRTFAEHAGKDIGQPIVFENRPGAGSRLGVLAVMRAAPDGYTIAGAGASTLTVLPFASATFRAAPGKDYAPVHRTVTNYVVMTANPSVPFRDVQGLIAYARSHPGALNFATTGIGSNTHMYWEQFMQATRTEMTHVPYKGVVQAMPDHLNGVISLAMSSSSVKQFIDNGKLIGLAVSSPGRLRELPNLPTLGEAGLRGVTYQSWVGFVTAPATPREIVLRLNRAFESALRVPQVVKGFQDTGFEIVGGTAEDFEVQIRADIEASLPIVKRLNLQVE